MAHALRRGPVLGSIVALIFTAAVPFVFGGTASAATPPVGLGAAGSFAVLAGSTVTNTGPSTINGDLGVSPGTAVTGFPPGTVNGTVHAGDAAAAQAQSDLTTAYTDAAGRPGGAAVAGDLGGQTLTPGVYNSAASLGLTGDLTLNGLGDPNAVFIFQIGSTLTTASASHVNLINAAQSCNVFWQVGSSATLGTNSTFRGNILALTSITVQTGATVDGRTLARNGAVTLDTNTVTRATCATPTTTTTGAATTTTAAAAATTTTAAGAATTTPTGSTATIPAGGTATTSPSGGTATTSPAGGGIPGIGIPPGGAAAGGVAAGVPAAGGAAAGGAAAGAAGGGAAKIGAPPQVRRVPAGGIQAGGGSTAGFQHLGLLVAGGSLVAASGVAWAVRRRLTRTT
ncbi:MAG: ice-binding family protein [Acidimicrobiales bacterium]